MKAGMSNKLIDQGKAGSARSNWLSSLNWQIDFYEKSNKRKRVDDEFDWAWFERRQSGFIETAKFVVAKGLEKLHLRHGSVSQEWVNRNSAPLWGARELLQDELSKLLFDSMLVLRCSSASQFYFPRIEFANFVSIVKEDAFLSKELPLDYLGLPLRVFDLELHHQHQVSPLTVLSTKAQVNLLNSYRQYFVRRNSVDLTPVAGDVVLDCGACIGEISVLIAGLVGAQGEVHLFDPVPLHARYCQLQASMNPRIAHVLRMNVLAVGDSSRNVAGRKSDSNSISPGGLSVDSYSTTTLDDYVSEKRLSRVDVIKMDIEGAEMTALEGASEVIRELKPRLAISAYHKPEDLWEIPFKLMEENDGYKLFFGHHSPVQWESVYYAA